MNPLPERMLALSKRFAAFSPQERSALQRKMIEQGLSLDLLPIPGRSQDQTLMCASYAQQRLWFLWQLEPTSSAYNQLAVLRLQGDLQDADLQRSIQYLIDRHEVLRSTFSLHGQQVMQVIHPQREFLLQRLDYSHLEDAGPQVAEQVAEQGERPFDLEHDLLLRATLIKLGPQEHVLLFCTHHIISDAWSLPILVGEVTSAYEHWRQYQRAPDLAPLAVQYADFAVWQRLWLEAGEAERQLQYWRERLGSEPLTLELPLDRPRPPVRSARGGRHAMVFDQDLDRGVRELAASTGCTLFMVLLASLQVLLQRYSGARSIRVGTPVANRTRAEVEGLIGFFVNTQVLQAEIDPQQSFSALLAQVKTRVLEAQAHQDLPFEQLVDALQPERSLNQSPLFQVLYNHLAGDNEGARVEIPGLKIEALASDSESVRFDLTFNTHEEGGRLQGALVYASDLFDPQTIEQMARHWHNLLQAVVREPQRRLGELPMLDAAERTQILEQWNLGSAFERPPLSVPACVEAHALRSSDAPAVVCAGQQLTYQQLNTQANRLARQLRERGVGPDVLVGIAAQRSIEMIVGLLAVLKAGGAYVPLDPEYPQERLNGMIEDSGITQLLAQQQLIERFADLPGLCIEPLEDSPARQALSGDNLEPLTAPGHLAYVIFTSGSTGRAKGVTISHGALANYVAAIHQRLPLASARSMALVSTPAADLGHTVLFGALCGGQALHVISADLAVDGAGLGQYLQQQQIDVLKIVPSHLAALLGEDNGAVLPCQCLVLGGEACPVSLVERIQRLAPQCRIVNHYGPTESTVGALTQAVEGDWSQAASIPLGRPLTNVRAYVLDSEGQPAAVGSLGELYLAGAGLARDYHRRPELTAASFIPDPFDPQGGARLYRTGDQVRYRRDGSIEFCGRIDQQIKIRGFRVEPGEIQACLHSHPWVRECAVLALDGPQGKQLVAYLVCQPGLDPDQCKEGLKQHMNAQLSAHQVPSHLLLLPALPLSPNGKLDRQALPRPEQGRPQDLYRAAQNPVQQTLVDIWQEVLNQPRIGINDNFFELGGDSIIAIQMVSRARQAGLQISSRDVFRCQSILELAAVAKQGTALLIDQGPVRGPMPLTPIQQVFFASDIPQRQHWNQSLLLTPREPLQVPLLERALNQLLVQHDALRLRYRQHAGLWQAEHQEHPEPVSLWRQRVADAAAIQALGQQAQSSLDLEQGPLLRAVLMDLDDGSQRLLLVIHHLVVDGVSWRILLEDLQSLYRQLAEGAAPVLPSKTSAFQDWAVHLQDWAQRLGHTDELDYWCRQLEQAPQGLPLDYSAGANLACHGTAINARLPRELTSQLLQEAPKAYRTQINDLLLAALARVICRWTGHSQMLVQLEGHGREELFADVDLSRSVGWFTSLYPLCLTPAQSLSDSIKAVKEDLRRVPANGLGYGALRYLGQDAVRERLQGLAQPRITFNYLGQFDQSFDSQSLLAPAPEAAGDERHREAPLSNWLTVNSQVYGGELSLSWSFSHQLFKPQTVQRLADDYLLELQALIEHCTLDTSAGVSPSDFPLAGLNQAQLDALPVAPRTIVDLYPLSPMQQGMLFHTLYEQASDDYVNQVRVLVQGLDPQRFRRAWEDALQAHDILRTSFHWQAELEQPVQIVQRQLALPFRVLDWSAGQATEPALEALAGEERSLCAHFDRAPLLRLCLVQTTAQDYQLIYTNHHILMDGWSSSQLMSEVLQRYAGVVPPQAPGRYRDYIQWLQRQDLSACESFWREQLGRLSTPTRLAGSIALENPGADAGHGEFHHDWTQPWTERLVAFARQQKITANTLLQAAWLLLLQRYTGQSTVAFGATVAGRPSELPGIEQQIGLFINTLPVIATPDAQMSVAQWLQQVQAHNLQLREYEHTPLNDIQRWAGSSGEALFDTLLVFDNYPVAQALEQEEASSVRFGAVQSRERTNYPLSVAVALEQRLSISYGYAREAFSAAVIERLNGHLLHLLAQLIDNPQLQLGAIELLTPAETASQCVAPVAPGIEPAVHESIGALAQRWPERQAVLFAGQRFTYGELDRRANRLAHELVARGVGQEVRVGVALPRGEGLLVALLAVLKAGGAFVPLDLSYPADRLAYLMADSGMALLLSDSESLQRLPSAAGLAVLDLSRLKVGQHPLTAPAVTVAPESLAYVIYTSGSTGQPKGVTVAHGPLAMHCRTTGERYGMTPDDCELHFLSFSFDGAHERWLTAFVCGASLLLRDDSLWTPEQTCEAIRSHGVTMAGFPPAYLHQLAEHVQRVGNPPPMRLYSFGGDAMPQASFELVQQVLRPQYMINGYGPTETVVTPLVWKTAAGELCKAAYAPIGHCVGERSAYVLDADLNPLPVGVAGELYIGGNGLARGYLKRFAQTAERFVPDPYSPLGGRLYRTGDVVRQGSDGVFEYLGRIDNQVKIRGFRIELGEIEARLMAHEQVSEAVVLAQDTAHGRRLVAYLVTAATALEDEQDQERLRETLRQTLKACLPDYMVPSYWLFLERLPLSPNGKLDRKALPMPEMAQASHAYVAPRSDLEKRLAQIWQDVLKLAQVGLTDNFFELGGDSIISLQLVSRARQASIRFTPKDLFEQQTIGGLAAVAQCGVQDDIDQGPVTGDMPLLPIQRLFFAEPIPQRHHFNQSVLLIPATPLNPLALKQGLRALLEHHDGLRLQFQQGSAGWSASHGSLDQSGPGPDLLWQAEAANAAELEQLCEKVQCSLDLQRGPLLRALLVTLADSTQRLLLVAHHLVVDGVSWRLLFEDLQSAYTQALAGQAVQLPAKSSSYQAFGRRLQAYAHGPEAQAELAYWRAQLAGAQASLPGVEPGTQALSRDAGSVQVQLDAATTQRLLQRAPAAYRTQVNDLLLAALAQVMGQWTGQPSTLIQLEGHGREQLFEDLDLSRTVGWFTSVFPVRLSAADSAESSIKRIKEQLRAIPNKGIGYGALRYLGDTASREALQGLAQPRVTFNYLGQFDGSFDDPQALFIPAPEAHGADASIDAPLGNWLSISGKVYDGQLRLDWSFSQRMFDSAQIESLAQDYIQALQALVEHCCQARGGVTPSDFPLARLTQEQLDALTLVPAQIEDIYPLAPMQQALLQHELQDHEAGDFVNQMCMDVQGVDPQRLRQAWQQAMDTHEILRSRFVWGGSLVQPLQVVHKQVEVPFQELDGTVLSSDALERLALADRLKGFDLAQAPLLRLQAIKLGEGRYRLICTNHHILLDGWSGFQLFNDVLAAYTGQAISHRPAGYHDYIAWLQARDQQADERFWREQLKPLKVPTLLSACAMAQGDRQRGGHRQHYFEFDEAQTEQLTRFARQQKITANTLVQAAWLLLLHVHCGQSTVACGATIAGRPPQLKGIEQQLGLYINDVPLVARIEPEQSVGDWLQALQGRNLLMREHGYSALSDIERWAGLPGGELSDTVIVFENYPVSAASAGGDVGDLRLESMHSFEQTSSALTLYVELKGQLQFHYDHRLEAFSEAAVQGVNLQLVQLLGVLADGSPARSLAQVLAQLGGTRSQREVRVGA